MCSGTWYEVKLHWSNVLGWLADSQGTCFTEITDFFSPKSIPFLWISRSSPTPEKKTPFSSKLGMIMMIMGTAWHGELHDRGKMNIKYYLQPIRKSSPWGCISVYAHVYMHTLSAIYTIVFIWTLHMYRVSSGWHIKVSLEMSLISPLTPPPSDASQYTYR